MKNSPLNGIAWGIVVILAIVSTSMIFHLNGSSKKYEEEKHLRLGAEAEMYELNQQLVLKDKELKAKQEEIAFSKVEMVRLEAELKAAMEVKKELERQVAIALGLGPKDD